MRLPIRSAVFLRPLALVLIGVAGAVLAGCKGAANQTPTQTPLVIIVTGETPGTGSSNGTASSTQNSDIFPTPHICQAEIVEQGFEHGRLFWIAKSLEHRCATQQEFEPGTGEIWVAIFDESGRGGEWLHFEDDWDATVDPEQDPDLVAPAEGLIQPVRGFGKVWRDKLSAAQRETLGWGITFEIKFVTEYRYEAGGFIDSEGQYVPRPGLHILTSFGRELFYFDEPSQTFDYIPAED